MICDTNNLLPAGPKIGRQFRQRAPSDDMQVSVLHDLYEMAVVLWSDRIRGIAQSLYIRCSESKLVADDNSPNSVPLCETDHLADRRIVLVGICCGRVDHDESRDARGSRDPAFKAIAVESAWRNDCAHHRVYLLMAVSVAVSRPDRCVWRISAWRTKG
jgi:hypothetical protein